MSYNVNIPQVTDKLLQLQPQFKANYQAINTTFSDNHISMTNSTDVAGMHSLLTLRPQTLNPVTGANTVALYNKLVASVPELFFMPHNAATPIQLTYPSISVGSAVPYPNDQYTFMAGPFIVYGGFIANATNGQTKTLTPGTTLLYVGLTTTNFTQVGVVAAAAPTNIVGNSFDIVFQASIPNTRSVYYFAIGV